MEAKHLYSFLNWVLNFVAKACESTYFLTSDFISLTELPTVWQSSCGLLMDILSTVKRLDTDTHRMMCMCDKIFVKQISLN